jgi:D-amino-acid dehydrogenase
MGRRTRSPRLGLAGSPLSKRVLIVGGGVVGLSIAYHAARKGHRVTIVDRGTPQSEGCSFGNAGMVVPSHFVPLAAPGMIGLALRRMWSPESPVYMKPRPSLELLDWGFRFWRAASTEHSRRAAPLLRDLHLASRAVYEEWNASWGDGFGWTTNGLLMLCQTEKGMEEETRTAERARGLGIPAEILDAKGTAEIEPNLKLDVEGSVHFPLDSHLTPGRLMAILREKSQDAGVDISWDTSLTGWRAANGRVTGMRTNRGELVADEYVLSAGAWSAGVVRELGIRLPLQAGKGYSLTLPRPKRLPRVCAILSEAHVAVTPMDGALRFGGTMELAGLDEAVDPARVRGILKAIPRYMPEFTAADFDGVTPWCGLRPCSPDGLPYVGRFGRHTNLSAATGHAMMGVSLAPVTGRLMAEVLSDEPPFLDITALRPDRFS